MKRRIEALKEELPSKTGEPREAALAQHLKRVFLLGKPAATRSKQIVRSNQLCWNRDFPRDYGEGL